MARMDHALADCLSCGRHVRRADAACPFCGAAAPAPSARPAAPRGVSRSQVLAFGAAVSATLAIGCDSSSPSDGGGGGTDAGPSDDAGLAMPYGAPPMREELV